ncbi:MAG: murein biosynthesis integral membrane protein MurJ [Geminicoccaceae bacterium]
MSVGRAALTVGALTALSRIAGFARDLLVAAAMGAGPVADAFFISLKLANFLRRLFAEGAFAVAFVPVYLRLRASGGREAAARFAGGALSCLALALLAVVVLGELAMPWLVRILATGFAPDSRQYALAVELGRITFPYLLLISLAALLASLLQASQRFAAAAFAPTLLNLVLIAALLVTGARDLEAARVLAWSVLAAGVVQLGWLAVAARRAGLLPMPRRPRLTPEVRRLLRLVGPGLVGIGVVQLNLLVASWFATHLPAGTVSYLFYADRLVQLPLGIVGVALGTALLPALSREVDGRRGESEALNRAVEAGLLLGLPAAVGLVLLAEPIVTVLFERGAFDAAASAATAQVLAALALGVPAQILAKVLAPGFFAREDTATPVRVAAGALVANIVLAAVLTPTLGHVGVALALSVSSWVNMLGLAALLGREDRLRPDPSLRRRTAVLIGAVLAMAAVIWILKPVTGPGAVSLAAVIGVSGLTFAGLAWAAGAVDLDYWRRASRA